MGGQRQAGEKERADLARDRYVALVVGAAGAVGEAIPGLEMVFCRDVDEALVWLQGSRSWSALVVDRSQPDLSEAAARRGIPVVDRHHAALFEAAGRRGIPVAMLPAVDLPGFLRERATPVRSAQDLSRCGAALGTLSPGGPPGGPLAGELAAASPVTAGPGVIITVCGPGGTGASTVAMAVAAGLASRHGPNVVLADLALRAGQAVLHQVAPTSGGLEELVHAYRCGRPSGQEVRDRTITVDGRAYRLLVGLHRPSHWTAIRPMAFDAALEGLRATFSVVVADVTADLEGEADTGSTDIEERNHMARRTVATSDVIVVVGARGATGRRALDATVEAVRDHRGDATGVVAVLNGTAVPGGAADLISVGPLPASGDLAEWGRPITDAIAPVLADAPSRQWPRPTLVSPGSIGHWPGAR